MRRLGAWVYWRWWEQEGIDLAGARVCMEAAVTTDGEEERRRVGEEKRRRGRIQQAGSEGRGYNVVHLKKYRDRL